MRTRTKQGTIVAFMRGHIGGKISSIANGMQNLIPVGVGEKVMLEIEYARWDLNSHYLRRLNDESAGCGSVPNEGSEIPGRK